MVVVCTRARVMVLVRYCVEVQVVVLSPSATARRGRRRAVAIVEKCIVVIIF